MRHYVACAASAAPKISLLALGVWLAFGHGAIANAAPPAQPIAHCPWGQLGCNNPPPAKTSAGSPATHVPPAHMVVKPNRAQACNKDLSSGDECWTNCKTEDDITICDIIRLDTFMPEAPGGAAKPLVFTGKTVQKIWRGEHKAIGRVMAQ